MAIAAAFGPNATTVPQATAANSRPRGVPAGQTALNTLVAPGGGGGGGSYYTPYTLPGDSQALQRFRDMQMAGATGLTSLMGEDTSARRKAIEDALYAGQEESINRAADRNRMSMLEGTFGSGVGNSSITVELAGRLAQENADALARARREAFTQAGAEDRADLASRLGLASAGFGAGLSGLQAEANVGLANAARQQQGAEFGAQMGLENQKLAQQSQQFQSNLAFQYAQLQQQAALEGRRITSEEQQRALDRALAQTMQQAGFTFTGGENALNRAQQTDLFNRNLAFQGGQNDLNRAQALDFLMRNLNFQGGENAANRSQQLDIFNRGLNQNQGQFQANLDYNTQQRALDRALQNLQFQQTFNQRADLADASNLISGAGLGAAGLASLFGPSFRNLMGMG